jgi:hypothetical protein
VSSPAAVTLAADSTSGITTPKSETAQSAGATNSAVSVLLTSVATTSPLVAGDYGDVLTVTIEPAS